MAVDLVRVLRRWVRDILQVMHCLLARTFTMRHTYHTPTVPHHAQLPRSCLLPLYQHPAFFTHSHFKPNIIHTRQYRTTHNFRDAAFLGPRLADKLITGLLIMSVWFGMGEWMRCACVCVVCCRACVHREPAAWPTP